MNDFWAGLDRLLDEGMPHLIAAPILLPLLAATLMLPLGEARRRLKSALGVLASCGVLLVALALLRWVDTPARAGDAGAIGVFLPGNWPAPFGIVLVADRLSVLMLTLTALIGLASTVFATARWDRAGIHFHPLLQLQLMGLYGAFLTGDLFNLFVFFEITLAASYGLLLHGSGRLRTRAGLHYLAFNLATSSLFLIGAALLYGATGTLNLADLAQRIATTAPNDRALVHAGAAILATAFLAKAGAWPLNFWLVPAYNAAVAPVSSVFALLTKLGVYVLLRLWTLGFAGSTGTADGAGHAEYANASAPFGQNLLLAAGLATLLVGAIGTAGTQRLSNLCGFAVLMSAGTVLGAIGFADAAVLAGALYYLLASTLAISALFLLTDMIERWRNGAAIAPHEVGEHAPFLDEDLKPDQRVNLDDDEQALLGRAIPGSVALLGIAFMACAVLLAGLPPLAGFVGKFAMLSALFAPTSVAPTSIAAAASVDAGIGWVAWTFAVLLIGSGFMTLVALSRTGIRHFWGPNTATLPTLPLLEVLPVGALLLAAALLTIGAEPVLRQTQAAADALLSGERYRRAVFNARPRVRAPRADTATTMKAP